MRTNRRLACDWRWLIGWLLPIAAAAALLRTPAVSAQLALPPDSTAAPASQPVPLPIPGAPAPQANPAVLAVAPQLIGRPVEDVQVVGNSQVSTQVILNLVRTHVGDKFDPTTVQDDYQRIYGLKRFADVQARVQPTATGVIVIFQVTEEKLIHAIRFTGNADVSASSLEKAIDLKVGEAIEPFRLALAKHALLVLYRSKNYPFAHVNVPNDPLTARGEVIFEIVEGPHVRVRKIAFIGNRSFTYRKLNDQVKTTRWYWIFNPGTFDPEVVEDDVASLQKFYQGKGFFDVRVGRKLIFSPDQSELQIDFLIDEGVRYRIDRVRFTGNTSLTEAQLRSGLVQVEGQYFDNDLLQKDVRQVVRDYSPLGYIYDPDSANPDYLRIGKPNYPYFPVRVNFRRQPGTVELVYEIAEGKPFRIGRILVKGNERSQDKLVLRELQVAPGEIYNSGAIEDAVDRLKGTPYFDNATITPIGNAPSTRDLLVEVHERQTASFSVGAGFNTNAGLEGNITFEQRNFDIADPPDRLQDLLSDRSYTGAGQTLRVSFEPGFEITNASVLFSEPYLFDSPFSFTTEAYYHDLYLEAWDEARAGSRFTFGRRFSPNWSGSVTLQAEDVDIHGIEDYYPTSDRVVIRDRITGLPEVADNGQIETRLRSSRAPEILDLAGHSTITNMGVDIRRDTTNHGPITYTGSNARFGYQAYGALGGQFYFNRINAGYGVYQSLGQDLLGRKTVASLNLDGGYIFGDAPFYERYYGGGIGSLRGFAWRGMGPRDGYDNDPVGGDLNLDGTLQISYPLYGDSLRGVVFTDFGTVEPGIQIHTLRASAGFGVRLVLPFLGQAPVALDLAIPYSKERLDEVQYFSFQFGSSF